MSQPQRILEAFWQAVHDDADPRITVISAWIDHETDKKPAICVVFNNRAHLIQAELTIGVRWIPMIGFDGTDREVDMDETRYAAIFYFDCVKEPLGHSVRILKFDEKEIAWIGMLGQSLPEIPTDN